MPWCQSVCLSVCLWRLCTVVSGCDWSRISLHAWIDRCLYYLLTTTDPDRRMVWCRDFWWKRGGCMEKVVIVAISLILLIFYRWTVTTWRKCLHERYWNCNFRIKCIVSEDGTTNYHIGLKRRHIVRILPTYKTRNRICVTDVRKVRNGKVRTS